MSSSIRLATVEDAPAIRDIFNHYVVHSTSTYACEPETLDARLKWFEQHGERYPVTVAERDGQVVGWASLSRYFAREGYRFTAEDSIYVRHDQLRGGVGRALLADLIERARQADHHSLVAIISADQEASIGIHERFGFREVGRLPELGFKFGRWLDVVYLQKTL